MCYNGEYGNINIIWNIKSRRLRWARHVAHMRDGRDAHRIGGET
jgi:hypothetical protein